MGALWSRGLAKWLTRHERRLLLIGLDGAGKTTILYNLRLGKAVSTVPTVGFNVETDVGGQDTLRPYWRHHFTGTQGVIFVLDSADSARLALAKAELNGVIADEQLKNVCLLILLNKQDLPDAQNEETLVELLDFRKSCGKRKYHVQTTVATNGTGIAEGIRWLCDNMDEL